MIGDTILALASPPGPASRAILRLSGPDALAAAACVFAPAPARVRAVVEGLVRWQELSFPAFALVLPGPASFTGEDTVELHLPGSPLLAELLQRAILQGGGALAVRPALPGEFTRRAFVHGRLDLAQAEGVLQLVHGADAAAAAAGLAWLQGGLGAATTRLRTSVQDVLATIEAGLDFAEGETGTVNPADWLPQAQAARDLAVDLLAGLPAVRQGGELLLLGAANAGKSSLCNALLGREELLVDAVAGTTRDLLRVDLGEGVALWDAPGDLEQPGVWDAAALGLRDRLGAQAAGALVVVDPADPRWPQTGLPVLAVVFTKADLGRVAPADLLPGVPRFVVSARTGEGLPALLRFLRTQVCGGAVPGAPVRAQVEAALRALSAACAGGEAELVAADLQHALAALDGVAGRHSPEDLLDRIFGRFCLGK